MKWNKLWLWCKKHLLRLKKPLIIVGCVWLVACITGFFLNCLFTYNFKFRVDINLLVDGKTYLYAFLLSVIALTVVLAYYYKHYWLKNSKKIIQGDERDNDVAANLEQAHFQTDEEVEKNYKKISYAELPRTNLVGIPVRAVERKGRYEIHFAKNAHTMIIGTTGSGKTTTFINPAVQILSQSAAKPSMLISDPKGELYALHAKSLADKGYTVKVLDLRNPYNSVRWNPLERPFLNYQRMLHIDEEVTADEERGGWVFEGELYNDPEELQSALQVKKQWLFDQVYEDLHDMITVLCPITNKNEPIWESGAKNFILAIAIAMLEDSANPALGMTQEKYNFYNLMKIATNTEDDCAELMRYFQNRGPLSKALSLSKQVLDSADKTRGSYLSTMFDKLNIFADLSLCSLTSANEITFSAHSQNGTNGNGRAFAQPLALPCDTVLRAACQSVRRESGGYYQEQLQHSDVHRHERLQDGRGIFQALRELLRNHPKRRLQHGQSGRYKFQREHQGAPADLSVRTLAAQPPRRYGPRNRNGIRVPAHLLGIHAVVCGNGLYA